MFNNLASLIPYLVLFSHFALLFIFLALISRKSFGAPVYNFVAKHALVLALVVSVVSVIGSLFYSEIIGFEPCVLCWWQRVFLYPLVVIFSIALWKELDSAFLYAVPLALLAGFFALYHAFGAMGGAALLPCLAEGGECSKVYVKAFGYITIPVMSITISLFILLLAWANKIYRNENSNTQR